MSNVATTDSTPTPTTTLPESPSPSLSSNLTQVLKTAPELGQSPGLSVGVATAGGDVAGNSQAVARGTNAISDANAQDRVAQAVGGGNELDNALNWFGNHVVAAVSGVGSDLLQGAKDIGSKAMQVLNTPLQVAQHEYRYLHDVEARHGIGAALMEGIGIAGGAALGTLAGGVYGGVLGAEAAAGIEGQVFYKDSWERTTDGNTYVDPNTGQPVSLGRDIISELSHVFPELRRGTTLFKVTSGLVDGIADMNVGGAEVGSLIGEANSAQGASGLLGNYFGGTGVATAEDVDRAYTQYGSVRRAFGDIADKSAGEIAATPAYRSIAQQHALLTALGNADTSEEVAQIFKDTLRTSELTFSGKLPTLAITRLPFQSAREALDNASNPAIAKVSRAFTRLPDAWDEVHAGFSGGSFDPSSNLDDGTVGIYRTARFTENRRTAAMIANEYANAPDLATKIRIYRNLSLSTLFNLAGFRGIDRDEFLDEYVRPEHQKAMAQALDNVIGGGMFGREAVYGLDDEGRNLSTIRDPESGWEYGAAITKNQTGKLQFLDLAEARRAAKFLKGSRDLYGRADDFAYSHITQGIFKPLVLLTPSYAMHIALAEMIPNALRLGVGNLVKSGVAINVAKLGYKAENDDLGAISGLVWRLVGRNSEDVELGTRYIDAMGGQYATPGLSSGHDYSSEVVDNREEQTTNLLRRRYYDTPTKTTKNFGEFGVGDKNYVPAWSSWLHEIANDDASQLAASKLIEGARNGLDLEEASSRAAQSVADYLRNLPKDEGQRFLRSLEPLTAFKDTPRPADMDNYDEWARTIVANLRGATRGADRTMNASLLGHIALGETPSDEELDAIGKTQRPVVVKGREIVPAPPRGIQSIANIGFRKVLNPMVNFMSRQPIAFAEFKNQWRLVEPLIENGTLDEDEAMTLALSRTVNNAIRNVHNLTDRTQWSVTLRNWAPFYFAQEQAYRRMGRLLAEDPGAFRKYQLLISNIHDVGQVFQGKNGNGYFVMPGTGFLTAGVAGAASMIGIPVEGSTPVGMGWNLGASSVIFPLSSGFRPDLGPLVSIPTEAIAQFFPATLSPVLKSDLSSAATTILGPTATEPIYEQMVPNTIVQRLLTAAFPSFNQRSFNSTFMQTLATLEAEGKVPPPNASSFTMQTFIDRVRAQTQIMYAVKAIVGAVTPISPELTNQMYNKETGELTGYINATKSVSKGIQEFLKKNPDATPYTVFQSTSGTGVTIPSSVAAEKWINDNMPLIRAYPQAALLLLPPNTNTKYNANVYNEQIAQGLRVKWFPGGEVPDGSGNELSGYLRQLYVSAGNAIVLDKWYPQYEKQLQGLSGTAKYDAEQAWQTTLSKYAVQNPIWGDWWNSDTRETERGQAIQQMKALLASPEAPDTPVARDTRVLLKAYDLYQSQLTIGSQDGSAGESQSSINQHWKNSLYVTAAANPQIANVITGLFLSLPTTQTEPTNIANTLPGSFTARTWNKAS